jgi:hypothetical protein
MMLFKASPDKSVKIFTAVISFIFLLSVIGLIGIFIVEKSIILPVLSLVILSAFVLAYVYRPVSYTISNEQLFINRLAGDIVIPKASIKQVDVIDKDVVDGAFRTFGVGGLFGYFGKFSNARFGSMTWYVSRMDKLVLLTTDTEKILLSPDDVEGFVAALI